MRSSLLAPMTAQLMLKSCASAISLLLATPLSLTLSPGLNATALESATSPLSLQENVILFNTPTPPSDQGAPSGRQVGGAGRGACHGYEGLTALMPVVDGVVWGQTTTDQPTLWFYSPMALTPDQPISLVVQDKADRYVYQTTLHVDMAPGLISIQLPKEKFPEGIIPEEKAGAVGASSADVPMAQPYHWTFFIECDRHRLASSISVSGTLQKTEVEGLAPLSEDLDLNDVEGAIALAQSYASAGIWHDALTILGELNRHHPSNPQVSAMLAALLTQAGLEEITAIPTAIQIGG